MTVKKIAILLATYNGEKYLQEFLDSLVAQSCKYFELIVRDDGSSDNTIRIINDYSNKLSITVINHNVRLGAARNFIQLLIDSGEGFDCYLFADQDDYWHPNKIERAKDALGKQGEFPVLYCAGLDLVDSSLSHVMYPPPPRVIAFNNALVENIATGCTIALNSSARRLIIYSLPKVFSMHDWWMYIVISALGKVVYDDYPSVKYRQHANNTIGAVTSVYQDILRRSKRFLLNGKNGVFCISAQAEEFYRCYGQLLSDQQIELVKSLMSGKKTLRGKVHLAFASSFVRQKTIDTFILKILFLLGRF